MKATADGALTTHAQNFEDVMLWRALKSVEAGFYIDIGAQDPVIDSVSLNFYDHGWRGVHVEPNRRYVEKLRLARPDETVIRAAVTDSPGPIEFFEIPETGLSTADAKLAETHRGDGFTVDRTEVPAISLASLLDQFAGRDIHWLKIDVEGLEDQVISSWGSCPVRPWILVVESTLPRTQIENIEWEPALLAKGYRQVYFDGLNRFYLSERHKELAAFFFIPAQRLRRFRARRDQLPCPYLGQKD
jgi:FkbM family methyltransferase